MKRILVICLLLVLIAGSVFAQSMTGWESPQSRATQGRIRSASDDFIRPDAHTSIRNWFAMASLGDAGTAHLGYGKKLENMYIAGYYGGNMLTGFTPNNYTEQHVAAWPGGAKTVPVYSDIDYTGTNNRNNRAAVLVGIADMGFRLSVHSSLQSFEESDIRADGSNYKSYEHSFGTITPQFAWSMTKNLTDNGVRPFATLDLISVRNYTRTEAAATTAAGARTTTSANYFSPVLQVGLGGYNLKTFESGFRVSTDVDYTLTMRMYDNEYSYQDSNSVWQTKNISGLNNGTLSEVTYTQHGFTPYLSGSWNNENFAFRIRLRAPITIRSETSTGMESHDTSGNIRKQGFDTSTSLFRINTDLQAGMQWRIFPILALNAGGRVNFGTYSVTTVESQEFNAGNAAENSKTTAVTKVFNGSNDGVNHSLANTLNIGATLNPTAYLTFEANTGASIGNGIRVFGGDATGLLTFTQLLVSFRF